MSDVYTVTGAPGAPLVGDLVVVVSEWDAGGWSPYDGRIGVLLDARCRPGGPEAYQWEVEMWRSRPGVWMHAVRHPTPEELAAYQLAQGRSQTT